MPSLNHHLQTPKTENVIKSYEFITNFSIYSISIVMDVPTFQVFNPLEIANLKNEKEKNNPMEITKVGNEKEMNKSSIEDISQDINFCNYFGAIYNINRENW